VSHGLCLCILHVQSVQMCRGGDVARHALQRPPAFRRTARKVPLFLDHSVHAANWPCAHMLCHDVVGTAHCTAGCAVRSILKQLTWAALLVLEEVLCNSIPPKRKASPHIGTSLCVACARPGCAAGRMCPQLHDRPRPRLYTADINS
jgi:hypothetical protein